MKEILLSWGTKTSVPAKDLLAEIQQQQKMCGLNEDAGFVQVCKVNVRYYVVFSDKRMDMVEASRFVCEKLSEMKNISDSIKRALFEDADE